jgi:hypothetical protein
VQQGADTEVEHLVAGEAEAAAEQQSDNGDVHAMRGRTIPVCVGEQPDAGLVVAEQTIHECTRQCTGLNSGTIRRRAGAAKDLVQLAPGLRVLTLQPMLGLVRCIRR